MFFAAATAHRPWPLSDKPWVMAMQWHDLAFLHWPVPVELLRPHIPAGLALDTFEGTAWLGVVPFFMQGVRPRCCPAIPGTRAFAELNLRTYVTVEGKPGVWFFSLDAGNRLAVRAARRFFHLPYFDAEFVCERTSREIVYRARRTHRDAPRAEFTATYRPTGPPCPAAPGSIEQFLVERYCLYASDSRGTIYRGDIHHEPWPLQTAECEIEGNTLAENLGIPLTDEPPLVHFAKRLDVVAWNLVRAARASRVG